MIVVNIVLGFAVLFIIMALGIHIASTMFLAGAGIGLITIGKPILLDFGNQMWTVLNNFVMTSVPLFVLLGEMMLRSGVTEKMYNCLSKWLVPLPGGLLHTNIGASALLAANSGSSVATAATIGVVAIPAFKARGYNDRIVLGSIAAGGTLGILIPPSINMIIYGSIADASIGRLFAGGFIPGFSLAFLFMVIIAVMAKLNPSIAGAPEPKTTVLYRLKSLTSLLPILFVIFAIMGSIYAGWATPTEAAALGVLAVMIIAAFHGKLKVSFLNDALAATLRTTAMILLIMIAAFYMNYVLSVLGIPQALSNWFVDLKVSPKATMWMIVFFYFFLGMFIETIAMMVTTIPLVLPVVTAAGYDPVWFGVFLMILCEASLITPPVGMNLYVVQGIRIDKGPLKDVAIGV
ncbi:MAG TPA: TRAP transporter large permease subunit, partial [Thermodesulfobacteriota bacterium]|nr:TRAP transporter large permease subunit [Thermodesulfobacteriota bacterium]